MNADKDYEAIFLVKNFLESAGELEKRITALESAVYGLKESNLPGIGQKLKDLEEVQEDTKTLETRLIRLGVAISALSAVFTFLVMKLLENFS